MTKIVDEAASLCYRQEKVYFSAPSSESKDSDDDDDDEDDSENAVKSTALYYKNLPKAADSKKSGDPRMITDSFKDIGTISAFDSFIYVADKTMGLYAIEAFGNDEFSEPRKMNLSSSTEKKGSEPKP